MSAENLLPDSDRDLKLAQQIEKSRITGRSLDEIDDPMMPLLLQFREAERAEIDRRSPNSSAIWTRIETSLETEKTPVYHLFTRTGTFRWITAAAVLIIALGTFFWLFETGQPELIASSGSTISNVTLQDGSSITLRPYSALYEVSSSTSEQVYSVEGEAYFEVVSNPDRAFITETDQGRVIVLGTKYILQNWGSQTTVFLEEGRIRFETRDREASTLLEPGESSRIANDTLSEPVTADDKIYKDWLENTLVLENQPVSTVLSEIEQHFNITIDSRRAPDETLGGSIRLDSVKQVLQDLSVVLGGRFEQTGDSRYEYIPQN